MFFYGRKENVSWKHLIFAFWCRPYMWYYYELFEWSVRFLSHTRTNIHRQQTTNVNHTLHTISLHCDSVCVRWWFFLSLSVFRSLTRHFGQCLINRGCPFWMTILWRLSTDFATRIIMLHSLSGCVSSFTAVEKSGNSRRKKIVSIHVCNKFLAYSMNM